MSFLTRARAGAVDPADMQRPTPEQELKRLSDQMALIRDHLSAAMPDYQYSEPLTFGGVTTGQHAAYEFQSPFNTPHEYCVLVVSFQGAGSVLLSQDSGGLAPGLTDKIDPSQRLRAHVFTAGGAGSVPMGGDNWYPLPGSGLLYLAVNITTNAGYVTLQFRRRVSHSGVYAEGHL